MLAKAILSECEETQGGYLRFSISYSPVHQLQKGLHLRNQPTDIWILRPGNLHTSFGLDESLFLQKGIMRDSSLSTFEF